MGFPPWLAFGRLPTEVSGAGWSVSKQERFRTDEQGQAGMNTNGQSASCAARPDLERLMLNACRAGGHCQRLTSCPRSATGRSKQPTPGQAIKPTGPGMVTLAATLARVPSVCIPAHPCSSALNLSCLLMDQPAPLAPASAQASHKTNPTRHDEPRSADRPGPIRVHLWRESLTASLRQPTHSP